MARRRRCSRTVSTISRWSFITRERWTRPRTPSAQAAALYRRLPMEPTPESAESLLMLAARRVRARQAAPRSRRCTPRRSRPIDASTASIIPEYAEALRDSAIALASRDASVLAQSEAQVSQAVQIYTRLTVPDYEGLAAALVDLGRIRKRRGYFAGADEALRKALVLGRRIDRYRDDGTGAPGAGADRSRARTSHPGRAPPARGRNDLPAGARPRQPHAAARRHGAGRAGARTEGSMPRPRRCSRTR